MHQDLNVDGLELSNEPAKNGLAERAFEEGRRLARDPNICAVGYGIKLRGGLPSQERAACLVYFVREKLHSSEQIGQRGSWPVSARVGDYATDVVEVGQLTAATADRALPAGRRGTLVAAPLVGGTATMGLGTQVPGPGGYGTIGGQCFDSVTNEPLLLSNAHVWGQTLGGEVTQPVTASAVLGAAVSPAVAGTPAAMVLTRIPAGLAAPVVFANAVAQTYLITGSNDDPLVFGQGATAVPPATRTDTEQVSVNASAEGIAPAGRDLSLSTTWSYWRSSSSAVSSASSTAVRTQSKQLLSRRLFTNAPSYTVGQVVNLYAEIIDPPGGTPVPATGRLVVALLYPVPNGGKFIPRVLRPVTRQTPTTVVSQFTGFPAPARVGATRLPFVVAGAFTVDASDTGTFQTATAGTLPPGMLALRLPVGTVRVFVPPSTQVVLDIDLRNVTGVLGIQGVNSAGVNVGMSTTPPAGPSGRTLVTIDASELVEVRLDVSGVAVLYGVTSKRASPETVAPLSFSGSVKAAELTPKGKWGVSLFVQDIESGLTESANLVETAMGAVSLLSDCEFDVV